ncbi:MAG: hypothetical protein IIB00_07780 [candidate division Zixibacteria bacterium]|nr:hypothetical protein [candidate division Zixibacteria bacterium]
MKFRILLTIILALATSACETHQLVSSQGHGRINFANLEVGQSSSYIRFKGENYFASDDSSFVYFSDTLIVTVIAKNSGWFTIEEKISAGSLARRDSAHADSALLQDATNIYTNRIAVIMDSLYLEHASTRFVESYLFQFSLQDVFYIDGALSLERITEPEVVLHGWKTNDCACNFQGTVSEYDQLGIEYQDLNVIVNNESMRTDGPGHTYLYSREDGLVHLYWVNPWTQRAIGWDLL